MNKIIQIIIDNLKIISHMTPTIYDKIHFLCDSLAANEEKNTNLRKVYQSFKKYDTFEMFVKDSIILCLQHYNKIMSKSNLSSDDLTLFLECITKIVNNLVYKYENVKYKSCLTVVEVIMKCLYFTFNTNKQNNYFYFQLLESSLKLYVFDVKHDKPEHKSWCC